MLVICGALLLFQFFASDKLALRAMGAREVTPGEAPELHAMIERLCIQADIPKPKIAVADTQMPNAFAMGRSRKDATVCVTTGATVAATGPIVCPMAGAAVCSTTSIAEVTAVVVCFTIGVTVAVAVTAVDMAAESTAAVTAAPSVPRAIPTG